MHDTGKDQKSSGNSALTGNAALDTRMTPPEPPCRHSDRKRMHDRNNSIKDSSYTTSDERSPSEASFESEELLKG